MSSGEAKTARSSRVDRFYRILTEEGDTRVCRDISEEACHEVPGNFFRLGVAQTLTRLADELANAKTVLPWLLGALGASTFWVGFLVPVRESFSMLPQLLIAGAVRRRPLRKGVWVLGAVLQAIALAVLAGGTLVLRGSLAGGTVVLLLLLFSLARGVCSVASKDVLGKTIPKRRRGRLTGFTAALSGALTLGIGVILASSVKEVSSPVVFSVLLFLAAGLWLVAVVIFGRIREIPGATGGGADAIAEAWKRLNVLRTDPDFRRFVLVRALLISTALAGPYYVVLARESGDGGRLLGLLVLASGLASVLSSAIWGRYADRSSRGVLLVSASLASGLGLIVFVLAVSGVLATRLGYVAPVAFFILSIAHSGVRIGRKTYVVDLATGDRRTDYVAVGNTVTGAVLLASGLLGLLSPVIGAAGMLLLLSMLGFAGVLLGVSLPEVED